MTHMTTVQVDDTTLQLLKAYKVDHRFDSYDAAIRHLIDSVGER